MSVSARRLYTFLQATEALGGGCLEMSSMVPPAVRAANLAAFTAGSATVSAPPLLHCAGSLSL